MIFLCILLISSPIIGLAISMILNHIEVQKINNDPKWGTTETLENGIVITWLKPGLG
jgi:hypothetical protein